MTGYNYTETELISFGFEPPAARQTHNLDDDYVCPKEPASSTLRNIKFSKDSGKKSSRTNQIGKQNADTPGPGQYKIPDTRIRGACKFNPPGKPPKSLEKTGPITKIDVATAYNLTHSRVYGGVVSKKKRKMFGETSKHAPAGTPMKDVSISWNNTQPKCKTGPAWKTPAKAKDTPKKTGPATITNINYRASEEVCRSYSIGKSQRFPKTKVLDYPGPGHYVIDSAEKKSGYMAKWSSTKGYSRGSGNGFM